jgi:crotonobetainyl-CoA:carnitine CoA-transferase CaiB-like acyl-CoA transferase
VLGAAARFDGQRLGNAAPCPALGEQTREILAELGRDAATIDACAAAGIIAG